MVFMMGAFSIRISDPCVCSLREAVICLPAPCDVERETPLVSFPTEGLVMSMSDWSVRSIVIGLLGRLRGGMAPLFEPNLFTSVARSSSVMAQFEALWSTFSIVAGRLMIRSSLNFDSYHKAFFNAGMVPALLIPLNLGHNNFVSGSYRCAISLLVLVVIPKGLCPRLRSLQTSSNA